MKYKYTGPDDSITIRGVTFKKGKAVEVEDAATAAKISVLPYFSIAKRKPKNADKT